MKQFMKKTLFPILIATSLFAVGCDEKKQPENVLAPQTLNDVADPVVAKIPATKIKPAFAVFSSTSGMIHVLMKPVSGPADFAYQNICPAGSQPFGIADINFGGKLYCNNASTRSIQAMDLASNAELYTWNWPADIRGTPIWNIGRWQSDKDVGLTAYDSTKGVFHVFNSGDKNFVLSHSFEFGGTDNGTLPLVGDWDGQGTDSIGVYRTAMKQVFLRNALDAGVADVSFGFGDVSLEADALPTSVNVDKTAVIAMYSSNAALVVFSPADNSPAQFLFGAPSESKQVIPVR